MRTRSVFDLGCVLSMVLLGACADGSRPDEQTGEVSSALELPIISCQQDHLKCVLGAQGIQGVQACDQAMGTCLQTAANQANAAAQSLDTCRSNARDCLRKGGAQGAQTCRTEYEACVAAIAGDAGTPSAPSTGTGAGMGTGTGGSGSGTGTGTGGLPGLPGLPGTGTGVGTGGFPGLPGFPNLGGGTGTGGSTGTGAGQGGNPVQLPALPGTACLDHLRTCVTSGVAPTDCADKARACLQGGKADAGTP